MNDQVNSSIASSHAMAPNELPPNFRLTSTTRLPARIGRGIYNEATLFHDKASLRVSWHSAQVDSRLRRGCYVQLRGAGLMTPGDDVIPITGLEILDKPLPCINPFEMIPPNWVGNRELILRACKLWGQLSRPFQHLINAVFWDPGRFYRYVTGPMSPADHYRCPNGNFQHAVDTAEQVAALACGLPDVSTTVLIAAALLHDAGKADDYRLSSDGNGFVLSERGRWIGYRHTILEWLAVARARVIMPDAHYLMLIHALVAARGVTGVGQGEVRSIEAMVLSVADKMMRDTYDSLLA